jgi:hypothetical protein
MPEPEQRRHAVSIVNLDEIEGFGKENISFCPLPLPCSRITHTRIRKKNYANLKLHGELFVLHLFPLCALCVVWHENPPPPHKMLKVGRPLIAGKKI